MNSRYVADRGHKYPTLTAQETGLAHTQYNRIKKNILEYDGEKSTEELLDRYKEAIEPDTLFGEIALKFKCSRRRVCRAALNRLYQEFKDGGLDEGLEIF